MKRWFLVAALLAASRPARADETFAATAFRQAEELVKQNKWADACPLYEASFKADPQLGVLLHLADCNEHVGKIATAFTEFSDAVELAHSRADQREAFAKKRADALAPKLPKLHLAPPAQLIPNLSVKRDGTDITVLVGTDMPIDPGDHEIVAGAPGRLDWKTKVTIGNGVTKVDIPVLEKEPVKPVEASPPVRHEGTVKITTVAGAEILLDSERVGTGSYEAKIKSGGHTLRVVASGMRPYQAEILVGDDETRTIDVPLEKEPGVVVVQPQLPAGPKEDLPSFEVGLGFAPGQKGHGDHPAVLAYRADIGLRLGRRVNFGVFAEYASVSASGNCGTDMASSMPSSPYDFGQRNQYYSCRYFQAGLDLYVHILPKQTYDPWIGVTPGFRFGFIDYAPYIGSVPQDTQQHEFFPGIDVGIRAGLDYHPLPDYKPLGIGGFFETQVMVIGDENLKDTNGKGQTYVSFFGGLRSSLTF